MNSEVTTVRKSLSRFVVGTRVIAVSETSLGPHGRVGSVHLVTPNDYVCVAWDDGSQEVFKPVGRTGLGPTSMLPNTRCLEVAAIAKAEDVAEPVA